MPIMIPAAALFCRDSFYLVPAAALIVLVLTMRWLARRRPRYSAGEAVLPLMAATALLLALARPFVNWPTPPVKKIVVLVELSPNTLGSPWTRSSWLIRTLTRRLPHDAKVWLVPFDRTVHPFSDPTSLKGLYIPTAAWQASPSRRTNIAAALAWEPPTWRHFARWLFASGVGRWPKVSSPPHSLAVTIAAPPQPDAGIIALHVTTQPASAGHRTVTLTATIQATGPIDCGLQLWRNSTAIAGQRLVFRGTGAKSIIFFGGNVSTGRLYHYSLRLVTHDPWPQDDVAAIDLPPDRPLRLAIVSVHRPKHLPSALAAADYLSPQKLLLPQITQDYGIFVLYNMPKQAFPTGSARALAHAVSNQGTGLVLYGGHQAFGPGGYAMQNSLDQPALQWRLERISPLASAPPKPPPVSITFLFDASGSMASHVALSGGASRFGLALHSAAVAAQLLPHNSTINVVAFSDHAQMLFKGSPAAFHAAVVQLQQRVLPTGPTNPDTALPVIRRVAPVGSMLIMLTDGQIPNLNISAWTQIIKDRRLRFTVIAPPGESSALRSLLDRTHTQHLAAITPQAWSRLLHRAVAQVLFGRVHHVLIPWSAPQLNVSGQTTLWTQTWLKAGARQIAFGRAPESVPLAAVWRVGLGKVAALCFQSEASGFDTLLKALLQRVAPNPADNHFNVTAHRDADHWFVRVIAMANGRFLNHRQLTLRLTSPDTGSPPHSFQLNQVAPGQYNCELPSSIHGFVAAISENTKTPSRRFISIVSPPELPARIWPATLRDIPPHKLHAKVLPIGSLETSLPHWPPIGLAHRLSLAPIFWILAALLGLLSIAWASVRKRL